MAYSPIWFIDDDEQTARDMMAYWLQTSTRPLQVRLFTTAQSAWDELERQAKIGRFFPNTIIVDGHLKDDTNEFREGVGFVRQLRKRSDLPQPYLIAFSGDPFCLKDMQAAGADATFDKTEFRKLRQYFA